MDSRTSGHRDLWGFVFRFPPFLLFGAAVAAAVFSFFWLSLLSVCQPPRGARREGVAPVGFPDFFIEASGEKKKRSERDPFLVFFSLSFFVFFVCGFPVPAVGLLCCSWFHWVFFPVVAFFTGKG